MPQPSEEVRSKQELRKAFVEGAKWWEDRREGHILWTSLIMYAKREAERRYEEPEGKESGTE